MILTPLPDFISDAAEKCLEVITKTENGQLCDIAADRACLEAMSGFAKSADNDIVAAYGDIFIKSAVLKTAYRAILTNKKRGFLEEALPDIPEIKKADLIDASLQELTLFMTSFRRSDLSLLPRLLKTARLPLKNIVTMLLWRI